MMPETSFKPVHFEGNFARRGRLSIDDAGMFEVSTLPWELMFNIKGKRFGHWKDYLVTPSIAVYREYFLSKMHVMGLSPQGMLTLSIPLQPGCNTAYWHQSLESASLPIAMSGELDSVIDAEQSHIMVLIRLELLYQHYSTEQIEGLKKLAQRHFMPSSAEKIIQLANWLGQILEQTSENHGFLSSQMAVHSFEGELLQRLAGAMNIAVAEKKRTQLSLRQKGLKKALDYIYSADNIKTSIPDLCKRADVSQRTLEYAFQETFNLSPIELIIKLRLHSLQKKLLLSSKLEATVMRVAYDLGLTQLGRVAREYKQLFHELPSETLKRDVDKSIAKKNRKFNDVFQPINREL